MFFEPKMKMEESKNGKLDNSTQHTKFWIFGDVFFSAVCCALVKFAGGVLSRCNIKFDDTIKWRIQIGQI